MTPSQKRRLYMVLGILVGVGVATAFGLQAFKSSIGFKAPGDVADGAIAPGKRFQLGGMVKEVAKQIEALANTAGLQAHAASIAVACASTQAERFFVR